MFKNLLFAGILSLSFVVGCGPTPEPTGTNVPAQSSAPSKGPLKIALVPAEDAEKMVAGFEPIRAQLSKDIGREVEIVKVTDYGSVIEAMRSGKVDLAWFGPLSLVLANQEAGAIPFSIPIIVGKGNGYYSTLMVKADSPFKTVADLKGKKVAFVDPGSASGNLVPRAHIMTEFKVKAEDFFSEITYAGSHDASLLALVNGNVDACAVQDVTYASQLEKKQVQPSQLRVLWTSELIAPSPIAHRKDFDAETVAKILASFKGMSEVLKGMEVPGIGKIEKFEGTTLEAYQPIANMAKSLGMTKEQMQK
jgi:phosphonate transport system substrate-binding protein